MNYLAHILLSGGDREIQIGNFIGDAVKGRAYKDYPEGMARGILLHRAIDSYTDRHPAVRELVRSLRPLCGRYSGIVSDVFFDYLLASRFGDFCDIPLKKYTRRFYITMIRHRRYLPPRIKRFMWHFISTDRLSRYADLDGIRRSLEIMVSVHGIEISLDETINYLEENQHGMYEVFDPFFRELQTLCADYLSAESPPASLG